MDKFIDYVEGTRLFTEFFANLPTPLNNVYFLILVAGIVVVMLFSNFIDMIFVNLRHRQIVKKAAEKLLSEYRESAGSMIIATDAEYAAFKSHLQTQIANILTPIAEAE